MLALERETRVELATLCLGSRCSTSSSRRGSERVRDAWSAGRAREGNRHAQASSLAAELLERQPLQALYALQRGDLPPMLRDVGHSDVRKNRDQRLLRAADLFR